MKKLNHSLSALTAAVLVVVGSSSAFAQTSAQQSASAPKLIANWAANSGFWRDGSNQACWRSGSWTPADAAPVCDGAAIPTPPPAPVVAAPAPALVPAPVIPVPAPKPPVPIIEKVSFAADALFDFDKSVLKTEGRAKLDELVAKLQGVNLEVVIAVGHTDSVGSDAYNQALSLRRADAVKTYLTAQGIEASRVYSEGKGEKQPIADNRTRQGREMNRRVEIEVVGNKTRYSSN